MSTVKYHANSNIKYYYQVKEALKELGIKHGPFQRGYVRRGISHPDWNLQHLYDLYDHPAIPFLILKLADTDFKLTQTD